MSKYIEPDFEFPYHLFSVGEGVVFVHTTKTEGLSFLKRNRTYHIVPKGTKATVLEVSKRDSFGRVIGIAEYKVRTEQGKVIDCVPEYALEPLED